MKKIISLIAALAMLFTLAACAGTPEAPAPEEPGQQTENPASENPAAENPGEPEAPGEPESPDANDPPAADAPAAEIKTERVILSLTKESEQYSADDGTLLLTSLYSRAAVEARGNQPAGDAINAALDAEAESYYGEDGVKGYEELARGDYAQGRAFETPYACETTYAAARSDNAVLSLVGSTYVNIGGPHGDYFQRGLCFDAETGAALTLSDLSDDPQGFVEFASARVLELAAAHEYADGYFEDYAEHISEVVCDGFWYFDAEGLSFICNNYVFGPYAMGMLTFTLPYSELADYVSEKWMPAEADVFAPVGKLQCDLAENIGVFEAGTLATLTLDEAGAMLAVWADGPIYDVSVMSVSSIDGAEYYEKGELLHISAMNDGEVFWLQTSIPDTMPNIKLGWTQADGTRVERLLSQSGEDGSILLLDVAG